jgi:competence protein ComEC
MRCPAAIPAIGLGAGICAGIFFLPPIGDEIPLLFLLMAIASFAMRRELWTTAFIAAGFACAGVVIGHDADFAARNTELRELFDRHAEGGDTQLFASISGVLRSDAAIGPSGVSLDLFIDRLEVNGAVHSTAGGALVGVGGQTTTEQVLQWRAGRRVAFPATLRRPTVYRNPGVGDSERQLAWRGVALVGSVKSERLIDVVARGTFLDEAAASARFATRRALAATVTPWSDRSAAVVAAILIGDRAGLDAETERRLQEAGTYHVIAISGGNIAILAGLILFLLHMARAGPRGAPLLVIAMLGVYALVVDGGSSVARATLMASIYFAAQLFDHRTAPLNAAAVTAAILFWLDPLEVVDAGFALTFGATIGLLAGMSRLADVLPATPWLRAPVSLLAASVCAEVALLPIGAYVFSRVTFAGLIVNFAAIPLMTLAQIAGIAAVGLTPVSMNLAGGAGWIAHVAVEGLIGSAALVDVCPWLTRRLAPPSLLVITAYYACLLAAAFERPSRAAIAGVAAAAIWIVLTPTLPARSLPPLRITYLDVGQGDASIVQFPDGRTLSIDAGGLASTAFDIGGRVVSPAFWALGVSRLDYMSVTHGDIDHIGGASSVFRDFVPFEVWEGVPVPPHIPTRELRALADRAGTIWRTMQPDERVSFGNVDVIVHHPPTPEWERQRVRNDDSQVLEVNYGGVSFVFTGDIGRETEQTIARSFVRAPVRILKVPHHGSATSSSQLFLDALQPDIAIISAGRGNPFGHPVPAVIDRYRNIGAAIYRTDQDGAVSVETDGTTVRVVTFNGRRLTLTTHGR